VVKIWLSGGASTMRRITSLYSSMPNANSISTVSGNVSSGSSANRANSQKLAYMPSIRNSPCAKFTMSITPKIIVSPIATRA